MRTHAIGLMLLSVPLFFLGFAFYRGKALGWWGLLALSFLFLHSGGIPILNVLIIVILFVPGVRAYCSG